MEGIALPPWPREEEEYLMKMSDQCQYLAIQYNEIYNSYRIHETRFKLPGIILGSFVGMLSFGASQFGDYTHMITIGVGCSSIVISVISSIEAYLKIGETMTNSLTSTSALKKLKEKIDIELRMHPSQRSTHSTLFLRQCHQEYMDIVEKAPPLYYKGILSRLRSQFKRTAKKTPVSMPSIPSMLNGSHPRGERFQGLVNSLYTFKTAATVVAQDTATGSTNPLAQGQAQRTSKEILESPPIQSKLKLWANRAKLNTAGENSGEV
jgi:hypothetical protein